MTPIKWIIAQRGLTPTARLLLFYYCARANGELVCFPSYGRTAQDCELTRRGVIKGTIQLCASGQISIVSDPGERAAILAKAGAKYNLRVNVYRINAVNGADDGEHSSPSHSEHSSPCAQVGEHSSPTAPSEAALLAMCVPFESEHSSPSEGPDGEQDAPLMVNQMHADGEQDAPLMVNTVHPNLSLELNTELRARVDAPARGLGAVVRAALTGAPDDTSPPDKEEAPSAPSKPDATTGGVPANAFRPPDPFADWLDQGAPPDRALAAALARPKPIYAPPDELKAARQRLAQRALATTS